MIRSLPQQKLPPTLAEALDIAEELEHLSEALTHPSYANERRAQGRAQDYQRLEFLGDAVLALCVSEELMKRFPAAKEGELSLMRSTLVNTEALAAFARQVGLGEALLLGRGAEAAGERNQSSVLADVVEALIGAVFTDLGMTRARRLSLLVVEAGLEGVEAGPQRDAKSELQEIIQGRGEETPRYRVIDTSGPDHDREFVVVVESEGQVLGQGVGRSKKAAERDAARAALAADRLVEVEPSS